MLFMLNIAFKYCVCMSEYFGFQCMLVSFASFMLLHELPAHYGFTVN